MIKRITYLVEISNTFILEPKYLDISLGKENFTKKNMYSSYVKEKYVSSVTCYVADET